MGSCRLPETAATHHPLPLPRPALARRRHRDLKASNILIDGSGHLRLTDFGLAVLSHNCGKEAPSPERPCRGERSDVIPACCLGCQQVNKLKALTTKALAEAEAGLGPAAAGAAAADAMARDAAYLASLSSLSASTSSSASSSASTSAAVCACGHAHPHHSGAGALRRGPSSNALPHGDHAATPAANAFTPPSSTSSGGSSSAGSFASPRPVAPAATASASNGGSFAHPAATSPAPTPSGGNRLSLRSLFGGGGGISATKPACTSLYSPRTAASGAGAQPSPAHGHHNHHHLAGGLRPSPLAPSTTKLAGSSAHAASGSDDALMSSSSTAAACATCACCAGTAPNEPTARPWRERFATATVNPVCVMDCESWRRRGWRKGFGES